MIRTGVSGCSCDTVVCRTLDCESIYFCQLSTYHCITTIPRRTCSYHDDSGGNHMYLSDSSSIPVASLHHQSDINKSSVERQKGLTSSRVYMQLDPLGS